MKENTRLLKLLVPITRKLISVFKRGDWRMGLRPSYQTKTAPCQQSCPAGNDIRGWLALIRKGDKSDYRSALNLLLKTNPLPLVCGTVCHHPCEANCNRKELDETVAINEGERILGWLRIMLTGIDKTVVTPPPRRWRKNKAAIVGSGPAGLSCAWQLLNRGYKVVIFEKSAKPGGMLTQAIPKFRLPEEVVLIEIGFIARLGAEIRTNVEIGEDLTIDELRTEYNAVFIATGAHKSRKLDIFKENSQTVVSGLDFLKNIETWKPMLDKKIWRLVVIGGGNTAIDAARSAKKFGVDFVTVVYRRSEEEMPAQKKEVEEAKKEGIEFIFLAAPEMIRGETPIKELALRKMILGEPDESGRRKPVPTNERLLIGANFIISAIGEEPDLDSIIGPFGNKTVEEKKQTIEIMESQGIFIGGDALTGPSYVAQAIGQGREAAEKIAAYFKGRPYEKPQAETPISAEELNLVYFKKANRQRDPTGAVSLDSEATRCLSCGLCPQNPEICKNCWQFCPDAAVEFNEGKFEINLDYCKGCLICSQECPRHVVNIEEEKKE